MNSKYLSLTCDMFFVTFGCWTFVGSFSYFTGFSFVSMIILSLVVIGICNFLLISGVSKQDVWHKITKRELAFLCFFICLSIVLTLSLHRPDADDQRYLGLSILLLDYPNISLNAIPSFTPSRAFSSYQFLKSAFSLMTGVPILYSYYLIIPGIFAAFVVLIHWKLLRLLINKGWIVGLAFLFVIMLSWGDIHRTHANFGFVRLFQGKACFVGGGPQKLDNVLSYKSGHLKQGGSDNGKETEKAQRRI